MKMQYLAKKQLKSKVLHKYCERYWKLKTTTKFFERCFKLKLEQKD